MKNRHIVKLTLAFSLIAGHSYAAHGQPQLTALGPDQNELFSMLVGNRLGSLSTLVRKGWNVNSKIDGQPPIVVAAAINQEPFEVIEFLVKHGALVNARDRHGRTALHCLAQMHYYNGSPALMSRQRAFNLLIRHGAMVNAQDDMGRTPLAIAVMQQNVDGILTLASARPNPNIADFEGVTPLMKAVRFASPRNVELFVSVLEHLGADPSAHDKRGRTALDIARADKNTTSESALLLSTAEPSIVTP
jgi:ankyrin repeat protein